MILMSQQNEFYRKIWRTLFQKVFSQSHNICLVAILLILFLVRRGKFSSVISLQVKLATFQHFLDNAKGVFHGIASLCRALCQKVYLLTH